VYWYYVTAPTTICISVLAVPKVKYSAHKHMGTHNFGFSNLRHTWWRLEKTGDVGVKVKTTFQGSLFCLGAAHTAGLSLVVSPLTGGGEVCVCCVFRGMMRTDGFAIHHCITMVVGCVPLDGGRRGVCVCVCVCCVFHRVMRTDGFALHHCITMVDGDTGFSIL
jgi:hypothetical protein